MLLSLLMQAALAGTGDLELADPGVQRILPAGLALPAGDAGPRRVDLGDSLPSTAAHEGPSVTWALATLTAPRGATADDVSDLAAARAPLARASSGQLPEVLRAASATTVEVPHRPILRLRRVRLDAPDELLLWLRAGHPVIVGLDVDEAWSDLGRRERWTATAGDGRGRAVIVVGFERRGALLRVRDAAGPGWADHGETLVPAAALHRAAREAYAVHVAPTPADPVFGHVTSDDPRVVVEPPVTEVAWNPGPRVPPSLAVSSRVKMPAGVGDEAIVVIRALTPAVRPASSAAIASGDPRWSDGVGTAAARSGALDVSAGHDGSWLAFLPYSALSLGGGGANGLTGTLRTPTRLETTVYVDGFPVAHGPATVVDVLR